MTPDRARFSTLPPAARAYIAAAVAAGATLMALRLFVLPLEFHATHLAVVALALLLGPRTVRLGNNAEMSGLLPVLFSTLVVSGPAGAIDVAFFGCLAACLCRNRPLEPHRTAFNVAVTLLATAFAGRFYVALTLERTPLLSPAGIIALFVVVVAFYLFNTLAVALVIGRSTGRPTLSVWHDCFRWTAVSYLAAGSFVIPIAYIAQFSEALSFLLILPPVLLVLSFWRAHARWMQERARREAAESETAELRRSLDRRIRELDVVRRFLPSAVETPEPRASS